MKNEELQTTGPNGLVELPEYMRGDESLQLDIQPGDLKPPRLSICQSMTPQRKRTEPSYIPGLEEGDLFNVSTGEKYGAGPLRFVILHHFTTNFYFEGGKVVCRAEGGVGCELNHGGACSHSGWRRGEKGESLKPLCTKFLNFVIFLPDLPGPPSGKLAILPFKSSGMKSGEQLLALSRAGAGQPVFTKMMALATAHTKGDQGDYFIPVVKRIANYIPDETLYKQLKALFLELHAGTRKVTVDESEQAGEVLEGEAVRGDDAVPF
jgi:hypothetical protein